jgi:hypothetical protein
LVVMFFFSFVLTVIEVNVEPGDVFVPTKTNSKPWDVIDVYNMKILLIT